MLYDFNLSNIERNLKYRFKKIEEISEYNQMKVLRAFRDNKVAYSDFAETSGYGYGDFGRDNLDRIFAQIFGAEDAFVRYSITTGTQAIYLTLSSILKSGDILLSVTGEPHDTLKEVISGDSQLSLKAFGIQYVQIDLNSQGKIDYQTLKKSILNSTKNSKKVAFIQRSKGYSWHNSVDINEIKKVIEYIKSIDESIICVVDNCYGEFVQIREPTDVGADLAVGSLIKNPGGGIASCGGYVVGRRCYIDLVAQKFTAPGLGREVGAGLGIIKNLYMGLYYAPHVVEQAMKSALLCAGVFEELGYETLPRLKDKRTDIVQAIKLMTKEKLLNFCQSIQETLPVDSAVVPKPWSMPGYKHEVIMASGAFVQGSSIELSADAPVKFPFIVYVQGGTIYAASKFSILAVAKKIGRA